MLTLTKFLRGKYYLTHFVDKEREVQRQISLKASSSKLARTLPKSLSNSRALCFPLHPKIPLQLTDQLHNQAWCHGQGQEMGAAIAISTATITNIATTFTTAFTCLLYITIICNLSFPLINCESSDGNSQSHLVPLPWCLELSCTHSSWPRNFC